MSRKIKVKKNGPYSVTGGVPLKKQEIIIDDDGFSNHWSKDEKVPTDDNYLLCRCGKSKNKPFCDSSHVSGFNGSETAELSGFDERALSFKGPKHTLRDEGKLCVHAGFCDRAGSVWKLINEDNPESEKILKEEVCNCPSGRLTLESKNYSEPNFKQEISLTKDPGSQNDGPLWVKGGIEIESADGKVYEKRNRVTLCRCGKSKNIPFCDGSHMI